MVYLSIYLFLNFSPLLQVYSEYLFIYFCEACLFFFLVRDFLGLLKMIYSPVFCDCRKRFNALSLRMTLDSCISQMCLNGLKKVSFYSQFKLLSQMDIELDQKFLFWIYSETYFLVSFVNMVSYIDWVSCYVSW